MSREEAEDALADCLRDEPEWRGLLRCGEIKLAGGATSSN